MPGQARRLWALNGPTLTDPRHVLVVGETGTVTIPVPVFLIEHARGLVLIDTGLVPAAAVDAQAVYGPLADKCQIKFDPDQAVDRQLALLGFDVKDVTHVVMSHAHWDHTGGMYLFPHAQFIIAEGELQYAYWPMPAAPLFRREDLEPTRAFDWRFFTGDFDLFGDGSIVILHMPGHTPGNSSVLVRLANHTFLLAIDTAHLRSGYVSERPMPSDWNTLLSVQSIRRLKRLEESLQATLWISHDPEDWAAFRHAPEFYD